ncbi:MAG TPA: PilZ domain-containing protein, partial [Chloroflexota bacterium]
MISWPANRERRRWVRIRVDIPATLYLQSSDDLRRQCKMFSLAGGGCALYVPSLEPLPIEATHQLRFELPSRPEALFFDCQMVDVQTDRDEKGQIVRLAFVNPRPGYQDAIISYIQ